MARKWRNDPDEPETPAKRSIEEIQADLRNTPAQSHGPLLAELAEAEAAAKDSE